MKNDKKDLVRAPEAVYAKLASAFLDRWSFYLTYDHNSEPEDKGKVQGVSEIIKFSYPNWMRKNGGYGIYASGIGSAGACSLSFPKDGDVIFSLNCPRVYGERAMPLPFYADFESFKINDKEMLECAVQVQDTCTHHFKYHVRASEKLNILAQLRPHRYEKKELRSLLLAASSETLITEDLVDRVLSAPELKQYIRESE